MYFDSRGMAVDLAQILERDMSAANAWEVKFDDEGDLIWVHDSETVDTQPARDFWQRFMDVVFKMFPKEQY